MRLPTITLKEETLSNFDDAIQREWLVTNGLGGYASSTVLGINTRKYHGLLVAAFNPPLNRKVCLEKLDEEIQVGNNIYPLGSNEFQEGVFPKGYIFLKEFSVSPFPRYVYEVENVQVRKVVFMPYGKNAVVTLYSVLNKNDFDVKIRVFPLINWRNFHSVTDKWKVSWRFVQKKTDKKVSFRPETPKSTLMMMTTGGRYFAEDERWIEKIYYRVEAMRGESCIDNYYQLGRFETSVRANKSERFAISVVADESEEKARELLAEMPPTMYDAEALYEKEVERREKLLTRFYGKNGKLSVEEWLNWIILATDTFIVKTSDGQGSVIAGYHWFGDWGRDTFISLPGLMLVTRRFDDARKVFLRFKRHCKDGLIPNFLPEEAGQEPAYNSVDATLWYVNAVWQFLKYTGDFGFVREQLWENLKSVIEHYVNGTSFGIRLDEDGLVSHGPQLTWMDTVSTPRGGKAVEVQALWYNALRVMEFLANRFREEGKAEEYARMAGKAEKSFCEKFWNSERNCLFDVVNVNGSDASLRPNQIIAVALDFTMLDDVKSEKIVDVIQSELLTPYGLRTLARNDRGYVGVYTGDRGSRDRAYHNGTVWPWLLGPFTTAFLKVKGYSDFRREYALKRFLKPLLTEQIYTAGLGALSEIFDGEPPHTPRGCIAQAWSVAEPFRAYVEDVMQIRPRYEREVLKGLKVRRLF